MASVDPDADLAGKERQSLFLRLRTYVEANDAVWPIGAFTLLIVAGIIVLWTGPDCHNELKEDWASRVTTVLLLCWVALIYAWVIHCFAGDPYKHRTRTIEFAYFFVILSFVAVSIMVANIGRASSFGVVEGCIASGDDTSFLPIRCDHPVRLPHVASRVVQVPQETQTVVAGAASKPAAPAAPVPPAPATAGGNPPVAGMVGLRTEGSSVGATDASVYKERMFNAAVNHNYHHLLNIGGRLDRIEPHPGEMLLSGCPAKMIHGGVPVPVYFILLALIGAAISLARNVPIIQRRSEDAYVSTTAEPRLAPSEVRELLAFQVLQFVSAPFLAVAAYHTLKPESLATTVALGFLTGFASERILALLSVRFKEVKEKTETGTVVAGSIQGEVKFGGKPVPGATVEIEGLDKAKPVRTDAGGSFKFMAVPVRSQSYRLRATFTDKDGAVFSAATELVLDTPSEAKAGIIELVRTS